MVHAVKHDACLTTAHGSQERHTYKSYIIFDPGLRATANPDDEGGDEGEVRGRGIY